ncbi:MAG: radical SAM protein [Candidatus Micrarchaeia archaeon]
MSQQENDIKYLINARMMQKGFSYLYKNSVEFQVETSNLRANTALLSDWVLTEEKFKKAKQFFDDRIRRYLKEIRDEDVYITKTINRVNLADAELILSELFFKSQVYFLYNEVFTYGAMEQILQRLIARNKLDVEKTLLNLSDYKGTAIYLVYKMLAGFQIPDTKQEFVKLQKRDKKFSKKTKELRMKISDYLEERLTLGETYDMIKAAKEYRKSVLSKSKHHKIKNIIIQLYTFIVDIQRELFISQNIYMKAAKKIFRKFPDLDKKYGEQKPKRALIDLYLRNIKELKEFKLKQSYVYYKGHLFNFDQLKYMRLSDLGKDTIEAIIKKTIPDDLPILTVKNSIRQLKNEGIIWAETQKPKKPRFYIFMLELSLSCNLNCKICFNRNFKRQRALTVEEWCKIIHSIPKGSKIILFGGEPFLYPGIGKILEYIQDTNKKEERGWSVEIFTNGVLTERILNSLKGKEKLKLIFSIDGLKDANDIIRGNGVFDHTVETIKRLKAETPHKIEIRSVVTTKNYSTTKEFTEFFKRLGVDEITFTDLHVGGNAEKHLDYILTADQRLTTLQWLVNCEDSISTNRHFDMEVYPNSCGIGFNRIYIRSDGLVNSCSELDMPESNIFDAKLNKAGILEDPRGLIPKFARDEFDNQDSDCAKCGLLYLCGGGCRARALKQTGNINSCDTVQRDNIAMVLDRIIG